MGHLLSLVLSGGSALRETWQEKTRNDDTEQIRIHIPSGGPSPFPCLARWFDAAGAPPYAAHAVDVLRGAPLDKTKLLDRWVYLVY